jgi:hypothetical protein
LPARDRRRHVCETGTVSLSAGTHLDYGDAGERAASLSALRTRAVAETACRRRGRRGGREGKLDGTGSEPVLWADTPRGIMVADHRNGGSADAAPQVRHRKDRAPR